MDMETFVRERLRGIRRAMVRLAEDMRDRLGVLGPQYDSLSNRLDRMDARAARLERRLELREA